MSTAIHEPRVPIEVATRAGMHLLKCLGVDPADGRFAILGSVRRECASVKDLDILAPMPEAGEPDTLLAALRAHFYDQGKPIVRQLSLIEPPAPERKQRFGAAVRGVKEGFRHASVTLELKHPRPQPIAVEFWRYDAGGLGNRGWIELIRTGPAEFGQACCWRWTKVSGGGHSDHGYPHRADGQSVAVPTERDAFKLLGMTWIEPKRRQAEHVPGWRRAVA